MTKVSILDNFVSILLFFRKIINNIFYFSNKNEKEDKFNNIFENDFLYFVKIRKKNNIQEIRNFRIKKSKRKIFSSIIFEIDDTLSKLIKNRLLDKINFNLFVAILRKRLDKIKIKKRFCVFDI